MNGMLLASSEQRPGALLDPLQYTAQPPTKSYLTLNVNSAEAEKLGIGGGSGGVSSVAPRLRDRGLGCPALCPHPLSKWNVSIPTRANVELVFLEDSWMWPSGTLWFRKCPLQAHAAGLEVARSWQMEDSAE